MDKQIRNALLVAACATLAGCASTPRWDAVFGGTVRAAFASQVVRPEAVRNTDAAAGVDGATARAAYDRYLRAASNPPAPAEAITVGGSSK